MILRPNSSGPEPFFGESKVQELSPNTAVPLLIPHRHILNHLNIFPIQLTPPFWTVGNIKVISRVDVSNEARNALLVRDGARTSTVWLDAKNMGHVPLRGVD